LIDKRKSDGPILSTIAWRSDLLMNPLVETLEEEDMQNGDRDLVPLAKDRDG
jgi:hypothetical protein